MTTNKNSKDIVVVNYHEIPESICVETCLLNHKNEQILLHGNVNTIDLTKDLGSANNFRSLSNILNKPQMVNHQPPPTGYPVAAVEYQGTIMPLLTSMSNNGDSNVLNHSSARKSLTPAVTLPLNNTSQLHPFNKSTSVLPTTKNNLQICAKQTFSDRMQQTDLSAFTMKSTATQCNMDDEDDYFDAEWQAQEQGILEIEDLESEKENILKFIRSNSTQHKGFSECLICGEVSKSKTYFYGHMAIHRGPNVLCFKCGQNLDHEQLLVHHNCRKALQLEKAFLLCPHHSCGVKAISKLELYDHINEHTNYGMYKCSACGKCFCTCQEFLRHLLIRAKCYTSAKRKRFRLYGLESKKDRTCRVRVFTLHTFRKNTTLVKTFLSQRVAKQGLCRICLKRFANKSVYNRHRVNCITKFRKRLLKKRNK